MTGACGYVVPAQDLDGRGGLGEAKTSEGNGGGGTTFRLKSPPPTSCLAAPPARFFRPYSGVFR